MCASTHKIILCVYVHIRIFIAYIKHIAKETRPTINKRDQRNEENFRIDLAALFLLINAFYQTVYKSLSLIFKLQQINAGT